MRIIIILLFIAAAASHSHAAGERKEIVVVMPMAAQNLSPEVRSSLTESFIGELIRSDKYKIVSGKIVADAMTEAFKRQKEKKQQCDELACVREVAGNFGADLVLTIKVVKDGDLYLFNAKIEDITNGEQVALKDDECEKCSLSEIKKKVKLLAVRLMGLEGVEAAPSVTATAKKPAVEEPRGSSFSEGGISMVFIKGGCFQMGDTFGDGDSAEKPVHEVCVDDFYMGKYEVTNAEFRKFRPNHNSKDYKGFSLNDDNQPVVDVSWEDAVAYAEWLSAKTGKKYRLPIEAEWEYAARGGTRNRNYWGDNKDDACKYANVHDRTSKSAFSDFTWENHNCTDGYAVTSPVGRFEPNAFGLYDMMGNVREWCQDWYDIDYYRKSPRNNPQGASSGQYRVLRGGSWDYRPLYVRAAHRSGFQPISRGSYSGFRLAQDKN